MASEFIQGIERIFGEAGMKRSPTRRELYDALDVIKTKLLKHQDLLDAGQTKKASKPVVRAPAGRREV